MKKTARTAVVFLAEEGDNHPLKVLMEYDYKKNFYIS